MTLAAPEPTPDVPKKRDHPFRRAVLRGLGILMPPLLTIVLFIWAWSVIEHYVLVPVEGISEKVIVRYGEMPLATPPQDQVLTGATYEGNRLISFKYENRVFTRAAKGDWPFGRYKKGDWVGRYPSEFVQQEFLKRRYVLPLFLSVFLLIAYFLGKFVAAGIGHFFLGMGESLIHRLPLISNVYSSVKQVTDFVFSEREIEFNRVVAVEYPRKGIWSVGFVTGESMLDISAAANEPVLSVLMPTSPMPVTGFTITVRKSEAVDLNITIDQAIQFVVSCGVVIPPQQLQKAAIPYQFAAAVGQKPGKNGQQGTPQQPTPQQPTPQQPTPQQENPQLGNGEHGNGEHAEQQAKDSAEKTD